jgi:flagellar motor protein MotB
MTYADMITLLLCFFAIFLSISIPRKAVPQKAEIAQALPLPVQSTVIADNVPFQSLVAVHQPTVDSVAAAPVGVDEPPARANAIQVKTDAPSVEAGQTPSLAIVDTRPFAQSEIVDMLKSQGRADIEQKGDRITTLEISSAAFFDSGSAALSQAGESILKDVTVDLKSDKLKDYQITVEGHTDDTPINTARFPSNWELSTARASAVVHFFLDQGIPALKLRAAGYADTFPKAPNRDANGNAIPENQTQNRRVVIKMEKIDKAELGPGAKLDAAFPASIAR